MGFILGLYSLVGIKIMSDYPCQPSDNSNEVDDGVCTHVDKWKKIKRYRVWDYTQDLVYLISEYDRILTMYFFNKWEDFVEPEKARARGMDARLLPADIAKNFEGLNIKF